MERICENTVFCRIELVDGPFKKILETAKNLTPEERGELLKSGSNSEAFKLITAHQELAMEGQTQVKTKNKLLVEIIIKYP